MNTLQIIWAMYIGIIFLMFIIPFIYWLRHKTIFYSWNEMIEGKNNTPSYITLMLKFDIVILLLTGMALLVLTLCDIL